MKLYQLKQRFFNAGAHMPKYPAYQEPSQLIHPYTPSTYKPPLQSYVGHSDETYATVPFGYAHRELLGGREDLAGNLGNAMYQFFLGHPMATSKFSQCRTCLEVLTPDARTEHSARYGCYSILTKLLKALPRNECVVCGGSTCSATWNVPLCGPPCRELWKFEVCQPGPLLMGIAQAMREKVDAVRK